MLKRYKIVTVLTLLLLFLGGIGYYILPGHQAVREIEIKRTTGLECWIRIHSLKETQDTINLQFADAANRSSKWNETEIKNPLACELYMYSLIIRNNSSSSITAASGREIVDDKIFTEDFGWIERAIVKSGPDRSLGDNGLDFGTGERWRYYDLSYFTCSKHTITLNPGDTIKIYFHPFNFLRRDTNVIPGKYSIAALYRFVTCPDLIYHTIESEPIDIDITESDIIEWKKRMNR